MRRFLRPRRGFTLIETLVALMLFALFGLAAVTSLTMALRQWGIVSKKVNASQNARFVGNLITTEVRQGSPNPSAFGYTAAGLNATAVLMPNANSPQSSELIFNEPNVANFEPLDPNWIDTNPDGYRRVRYYTRNSNSEVVRETIEYENGKARTPVEEVIARGDFLDLSFQSIDSNNIVVSVLARQGTPPNYFHEVEYATVAYIVGK